MSAKVISLPHEGSVRGARYGAISTALHIINELLKLKGKTVVVTLDKSNMDDPDVPSDAEINQAKIEDITVVTYTKATDMGYTQ